MIPLGDDNSSRRTIPVITWLLVFVSGVPLTEKSFEGNEEFAAYARVTSRFFPWFPRRED